MVELGLYCTCPVGIAGERRRPTAVRIRITHAALVCLDMQLRVLLLGAAGVAKTVVERRCLQHWFATTALLQAFGQYFPHIVQVRAGGGRRSH